MPILLPGIVAVDAARSLAHSALPDAPVVDDRPLRRRAQRITAALQHRRTGRPARAHAVEPEHCGGRS